MSERLDPYYSRHDEEDGKPLEMLVMIIIGMALGMVIMMLARSCDREPIPTVTKVVGDINCQYCHGVRLDNGKRYSKYWKARRAVDHTRLVVGFDDAAENERMVNLIVGQQ